MTALTATPDLDAGTVTLEVTGAPAGAVALTRTDANGTNPVRLREGAVPIAGALTVTDYEAALAGTLSYDVVDAANVTTSTSTALDRPGGYAERFASVQLPALAHVATLITGYDAERESGSVIHRIIGRGDPVVTLAPARTRTGTLEVFAQDYEEALNATRTASTASLLMLRQSDYPGLDMWFTCTRTNVAPLEESHEGWRWVARIGYVEVRSPSLPLLGDAGWTFDDVAATYPDFASVRAAFADFADLLVGP